jgi:hypothetical protein
VLGASAGTVSASTGALGALFLAARVTSATRERPTRGRACAGERAGHWVRTPARADATVVTPATAAVMDAIVGEPGDSRAGVRAILCRRRREKALSSLAKNDWTSLTV